MSLADVAREMTEVGVKRAPQTVHKDESGQRKIGIGEAEAYARVLKTTIAQLVLPDAESSTLAWFGNFLGRADSAFEDIAAGTRRLLFARDHLERGIESAEKRELDGQERVREMIREAQAALENATPEKAVETGRQDYERDYEDGE